jgi:anhydro-N-acetylmuramic acid kinase
MFYRAIGLMSGSSLDGLDIVFAEFTEQAGKWTYDIKAADCYPFEEEWSEKLKSATELPAYDYLLLHTSFGKYLGEQVNRFIDANNLHHQVQIIASHGHTVFHAPQKGMTAQLGDGAAVAAVTGINVVSDLRALDVALKGQGAPIVPMGEKLLLSEYPLLLNIGGIANISYRKDDEYIAFDICPANRVLNMLSALKGKSFDENGSMASDGKVMDNILDQLNQLDYYQQPYPKSLANQFGTDEVFPLIPKENVEDALRTYVEHITIQIKASIESLISPLSTINYSLLITGGGAHNSFLVNRIKEVLAPLNITVVAPGKSLVDYKEALIMALLGILRWREQNTGLSSVTGAIRDSIGGAVWIGQEA